VFGCYHPWIFANPIYVGRQGSERVSER
jgi:hypothetical protein